MSGRTHGLGKSRDPLYRTWISLRSRCNGKNNKCYANYGARGIKVCPRWDDYLTFAKDMGPHPGPGWSIERNNVDGDYDPRNCTWATDKTQNRNRRYTILNMQLAIQIRAEYVPRVVTMAKLSDKYGVSEGTIHSVITNKIWLP